MKGKIIGIAAGVAVVLLCGGGYLYYRWRRRRREEKPEVIEYIPYPKTPPAPKKDVNEKITELFDKNKKDRDILRDEDDPGKGPRDIDREKFADGVKNYIEDEQARENLEAYLAGMESPEEDDEDFEGEDDEEDIHRGSSGPYSISAGDFCNTRTYYDKVSLNYFQEDNVVGDEKDKIFENVKHILGDVQEEFKARDYPNTIYIRNEELEIDYEINLVRGSYRKEVLHLDEEDTE